MKILLDTHVILWALTDDPKLSPEARKMITEKDNLIYYSLASIWEIAIKNRKSPQKCPYHEREIAELCEQSGYLPLEITLNDILGIRHLKVKEGQKLSNYDLFDRILLSQAKSGELRFLSHDTNFQNYDESCLVQI